MKAKIGWAFGELLALGSLVAEGGWCACRGRAAAAARSPSGIRFSSTATLAGLHHCSCWRPAPTAADRPEKVPD